MLISLALQAVCDCVAKTTLLLMLFGSADVLQQSEVFQISDFSIP